MLISDSRQVLFVHVPKTGGVSVEETVRNAATLVRAGAGAVKLEGGAKRTPMVRAIVDAEIATRGPGWSRGTK